MIHGYPSYLGAYNLLGDIEAGQYLETKLPKPLICKEPRA